MQERLTMTVGEAMFSQRAIRRLQPDKPISDEDLHLIMEAASKAPNGGNRQPGRLLVLRERALIRQFGALYHEAWYAKRKDEGFSWRSRAEIPEQDSHHRSPALLADEIGDAPVIVLAFSVKKGMASSVLPGIQNMMLAARTLGIGSTLTTLHASVLARVYTLLKVPEEMEFHHCIPLGYPRGRFGPNTRQPTAQTTFYNQWGNPPPWS